jgi:hypothetical protein
MVKGPVLSPEGMLVEVVELPKLFLVVKLLVLVAPHV